MLVYLVSLPQGSPILASEGFPDYRHTWPRSWLLQSSDQAVLKSGQEAVLTLDMAFQHEMCRILHMCVLHYTAIGPGHIGRPSLAVRSWCLSRGAVGYRVRRSKDLSPNLQTFPNRINNSHKMVLHTSNFWKQWFLPRKKWSSPKCILGGTPQ